MQTVTIEETDNFRIDRGGNGLTMRMVNKYAGRDIFFQEENADQFNLGLDMANHPHPRWTHKPRDWFLNLLWEAYAEISRPLV